MPTATPASRARTPPPPRVLVAGAADGAAGAGILPRALRLAGLEAAAVPDPALGLARPGAPPPDLVLISGPRASCLAQVLRLRAARETIPVVVLVTDGGGEARAALLDAGADDALSPPVALEALLAHVRAVLRRCTEPAGRDLLTVADVALRRAAREVRRGGRVITLTRTEHDVLETLLARRGRVTTPRDLAVAVWGHPGVTPNAVAAHVSTLRRKLEEGGRPRVIHTVHGVGYLARAPR